MFSAFRRRPRSAAWALSLRSTLAFAGAAAVALVITYFIAVGSIREQDDAWLRGETEVLRKIAATLPPGPQHDAVIAAIAGSATREITGTGRMLLERGEMMFFLHSDAAGHDLGWLGPAPKEAFIGAVREASLPAGKPRTVPIPGRAVPFRVVRDRVDPTADVYLGVSEAHALRLIDALLGQLALIWLGAVSVAWLIAFASARRMLARVESITQVAARIRSDDLSTRIPESAQVDEISYLARTLNGMLDRIAGSVTELRSLTESVAHELKSPVTSIRGRLEIALTHEDTESWREAAILAIEDLDRLASFVTTTLDVAEAEGGGLRIHRESVDFGTLVRDLLELYEPAFAERRLALHQSLADGIVLRVDASLMRRAVANLLDNGLTHLSGGTNLSVTLGTEADTVVLRVEDDGAGFPPGVGSRMFERFVKGGGSSGHGLGLPFTRAIVVAHGGRVDAGNRPEGGAFVIVTMPSG
jgi:signal transduction histidine kinase